MIVDTMDVKLALLADYANVTKEGKLNVMGIFTIINAPTLPWVHPQMQLVLQLEAGAAEWGIQKNIEIKLMDVDANNILSIGANLQVPRGKAGKPVQINSIMSFNNIEFKAEGDYAVAILIGGETKATTSLSVNYVPPSAPREES